MCFNGEVAVLFVVLLLQGVFAVTRCIYSYIP